MIPMARPSLSGSGATDNRSFKCPQPQWDAFRSEVKRRGDRDASTVLRRLMDLYMATDDQDGAR